MIRLKEKKIEPDEQTKLKREFETEMGTERIGDRRVIAGKWSH